MKNKLMKKMLMISILCMLLSTGLTSASAMKTNVQNDEEDLGDSREITIYVYIDEIKNNNFDDEESLATSAYVKVQRCDTFGCNSICGEWIDGETGSITIDVPNTLLPPCDYSITASENRIYFSSNQYKGRLSDIPIGKMEDGAEFWVGMQLHERKTKSFDNLHWFSILSRFPLLQQFLQKLPAFQ
jgi:hypothetical protein